MKLDLAQRKRANELVQWILDNPDDAAHELIGLRDALANVGSDQRSSARPACNSSGRLPDGQAPSGLPQTAVWCPTHGNAPYYLSTETGLPCCRFCGGPMVQTPAQLQQEGERERDARRYWRLRVLGAALCESKQLCEGSVLRFTNLDEAVDEDIRINPSRGEAELYALLAAQPAPARLQDVGQAGKPHEPSTPARHYVGPFTDMYDDDDLPPKKQEGEREEAFKEWYAGYMRPYGDKQLTPRAKLAIRDAFYAGAAQPHEPSTPPQGYEICVCGTQWLASEPLPCPRCSDAFEKYWAEVVAKKPLIDWMDKKYLEACWFAAIATIAHPSTPEESEER